jgi:hypothetical protein
VSSYRLVRKESLVIIVVIFTLVITSPSISTSGYFDITKVVYGQPAPDQTNANTTNSVNLQDIPLEKVHVGDIDVAYKMFGKGDPILLISPAQGDMNTWQPSLIGNLSANHTVIVFDNRGVGNTSTGIKPFSIQQFANDTAGLMDILKVQIVSWYPSLISCWIVFFVKSNVLLEIVSLSFFRSKRTT